MTNKILISGALIALSLSLSNCYYDVEEELYVNTGCDTLSVSFSAVVQPIISDNCLNCHSAAANFGGITLEGHAKLKQQAINGKLLGVIRHEGGFPPMPQGAPQLAACTIAKIEKWVRDGAPDN